jgi:hypothetical protein
MAGLRFIVVSEIGDQPVVKPATRFVQQRIEAGQLLR